MILRTACVLMDRQQTIPSSGPCLILVAIYVPSVLGVSLRDPLVVVCRVVQTRGVVVWRLVLSSVPCDERVSLLLLWMTLYLMTLIGSDNRLITVPMMVTRRKLPLLKQVCVGCMTLNSWSMIRVMLPKRLGCAVFLTIPLTRLKLNRWLLGLGHTLLIEGTSMKLVLVCLSRCVLVLGAWGQRSRLPPLPNRAGPMKMSIMMAVPLWWVCLISE